MSPDRGGLGVLEGALALLLLQGMQDLVMRNGKEPGFHRGFRPKLGNPAAGGFKDLLRDLLGEGGLPLAHAEAIAKDRLQVGLRQQRQARVDTSQPPPRSASARPPRRPGLSSSCYPYAEE